MFSLRTVALATILSATGIVSEALADVIVNVTGLDPGTTVSVTVAGGGLAEQTLEGTVDKNGKATLTFAYRAGDVPTRETKATAKGTKKGKEVSDSTKSWSRSGLNYTGTIAF